MPDRRLLERLRDIERNPDHRGSVSQAEIINSILAHLSKILNTRQGSALIAPDFGVPDYSNLATSFTPEALPDIEENIRAVIMKYEPRLRDLKISYSPRDNVFSMLSFKLEARLADAQGLSPVVFETVMSADGRLSVHSA